MQSAENDCKETTADLGLWCHIRRNARTADIARRCVGHLRRFPERSASATQLPQSGHSFAIQRDRGAYDGNADFSTWYAWPRHPSYDMPALDGCSDVGCEHYILFYKPYPVKTLSNSLALA